MARNNLRIVLTIAFLTFFALSAAAAQDPSSYLGRNFTVTGLVQDVAVYPGQNVKLFDWTPGWTYPDGNEHVGTLVYGKFDVRNMSNTQPATVMLELGPNNYMTKSMVIPPRSTQTLVGIAADGFTAPTNYADYSPYIYVPQGSRAAVRVMSPVDGANVFFETHAW